MDLPIFIFKLRLHNLMRCSSSGVLVDLHDSQDGRCTRLNMETVQLVLAAKWAVDVINNQSLPHELSIGKLKTYIKYSSEIILVFRSPDT